MDHTCRAVFILEEDHSIPTGHKPLMLEAILHRPIMERAVVQCLADGVQRFFVVCSPRFAEEAAACFPEGTDVVISEQHAAVSGASLVSGWLPIFGPETIAELEPVLAKMEQES